MKVVILAAGKGTRMGKHTQNTPKPLLRIGGRPILEHTLLALPRSVNEALIVVNYLNEQIKDYFSYKFGNIRIDYIFQKEFLGTANAVWEAKSVLGKEKFLVLNGDDLYNQKSLEKCPTHELAFGIIQKVPPNDKFIAIDLDQDQNIAGFHKPEQSELEKGILMATGVYVLDDRIFKYNPVQLSNGEYGLPQTILNMAKDYPVKGVIMEKWSQINYPEDIKKAEIKLN